MKNFLIIYGVLFACCAQAAQPLDAEPKFIKLFNKDMAPNEFAINKKCEEAHPTSKIIEQSNQADRVCYARSMEWAQKHPELKENGFLSAKEKNLEIKALCVRSEDLRTEMNNRGAEFQKCKFDEINKHSYSIPLFERPDVKSQSRGSLKIGFKSGEGITYSYVAPNEPVKPFKPDIFDSDWEKDSIYQTVSAVQGDWIRLPKNPFPWEVWLNWKSSKGSSADIRSIFQMGVMSLKIKGSSEWLVFLKQEGNKFRVRAVTEVDRDCGEGKFGIDEAKKVNQSAKQFWISYDEVFDSDGHIRTELLGCPKYGC